MFLRILMASVICVHFSQLVDDCNIGIHLNIIEYTHAKILESTLLPSVMR